jgi:hypothetical protein
MCSRNLHARRNTSASASANIRLVRANNCNPRSHHHNMVVRGVNIALTLCDELAALAVKVVVTPLLKSFIFWSPRQGH